MPREGRTAIDLFSGAGGISLGLEQAGFRVLAASDFDGASARTYRRNFPHTPFVEQDVRRLSGIDLMRTAGLGPGELDLLIGGPPCQGVSIIGARLVHDPRNDLFREFLRLGGEIRPRCMVVENVPGLATLARGAILRELVEGFESLGYSATFAELLAAQYGVPQMRWRMLITGFRGDTDIASGMGFPQPTHGRYGIGDLVPNCTITQEEQEGFVKARDAFADLPPVEPGQRVDSYPGKPLSEYQASMRAGLSTELYNHYAPRLSELNILRIRSLSPGQDWRNLPRHLLPDGMKRAKRKDHTRRYRRMTWAGVPRSIITRFRDPKSGEYIHPEQNRTISIREAARIQSFPDNFGFEGTNSELYDQVGNAVPPLLAAAVGRELIKCLDGEATFQLQNPFGRRPSVRRQAGLSFDTGQEPLALIG